MLAQYAGDNGALGEELRGKYARLRWDGEE